MIHGHMSAATPLAAGNHTVEVRAFGTSTGSDTTVGGNNTSVLQGELSVLLLKL